MTCNSWFEIVLNTLIIYYCAIESVPSRAAIAILFWFQDFAARCCAAASAERGCLQFGQCGVFSVENLLPHVHGIRYSMSGDTSACIALDAVRPTIAPA